MLNDPPHALLNTHRHRTPPPDFKGVGHTIPHTARCLRHNIKAELKINEVVIVDVNVARLK